MSSTNTLEIEDEEERERRIQLSLERLNTSSAAPQPPPSRQLEFGIHSTPHFVPPPTELLSRVQAFLPALEASNNDLAQRAKENPNSVDIEHLSANTEKYIEMNLGLGIFEQRSFQTSSNSPSDTEMTVSSASSSSSDGSTSGWDSDESDSDAEIITCFTPSRPMKPLPRRRLAGTLTAAGNSPEVVILDQAEKNIAASTGDS